MELNEKIGIVHKEMFQRMLGITELPDFLLLAYFRVKKLVDKVDGVMSPCDLARIAMDCGFDPEIMQFEKQDKTIRTTSGRIFDPQIDDVETITTGTPVQPPVDFTPVDVPPKDDTPTVEATRHTPDLKTVPGEPYPEAVTLYLVGQNVEIKQNDDILSGKVVGVPSGKKKTYTVMTEDDDTYEVDESDISEE